MPEIAYVNGVFSDIDLARVSIEDRGFQFGDGVYEVVLAYGGRLFLLPEHMARLKRSLAAIHLDFDLDENALQPIIDEGLRRCGFRDAMVYIQITRGPAPRSHAIPDHSHPTLVMTFKPLAPLPEDFRRRGARLMTMRDTRWANCYVKAITLLPNVLAKSEAVRRGFDDAVFVAESGAVRECTSANIFIVHKGALIFPPRNHSVLHGITQGFLLRCAEDIGVDVEESAVQVEELYAADEVFMSSTTIEVLGVTSVDERPIADGAVGPLTRRLFDAFRKRSRALENNPRPTARVAT